MKPNFKVLGKKAGAMMKALSDTINSMSQQEISQLEQEGKLVLHPEGKPFEINMEDVEIVSEDIPGWEVNTEGKLTVALDVTLSDTLREEGIAREIINRIQNIRKDKGYEVTDKIAVRIQKKDLIIKPVKNNLIYICNEILAESLSLVDDLDEKDSIMIEVDDHIQVLTSINKY